MLIIICFVAGSILEIGNLNALALPIIVQLIVSIVGIGTNLYANWKLGKINNQTIKQIESILSILNSKTVNYNEFKKYITEKNKVNKILYAHYQQEFFRKFKLNKFINMQKSETKMVENFNRSVFYLLVGIYHDFKIKITSFRWSDCLSISGNRIFGAHIVHYLFEKIRAN
jgi:hypothetical protein